MEDIASPTSQGVKQGNKYLDLSFRFSGLLLELLVGSAQEESRAREPTGEYRPAFQQSMAVEGQMEDTGHTLLILIRNIPFCIDNLLINRDSAVEGNPT